MINSSSSRSIFHPCDRYKTELMLQIQYIIEQIRPSSWTALYPHMQILRPDARTRMPGVPRALAVSEGD